MGGSGCSSGAFGGAAASSKGFSKGKGTGTFEEEDRSRDWYCPNCRERNFVKRLECFKCRTVKPKDAALCAPPVIPPTGTTLNGMVKSYNRKGFGFLMVLGADFGQDIYYTREALSPKLQTRDIPGQHVTFELLKFHDGKLSAVNIRPLGEDKEDPLLAKGRPFAGKGVPPVRGDDEDRTRDWVCACGERNFVKRFECFKCGKSRPNIPGDGFSEAGPAAEPPVPERTGPPPRGLSPHAGSRAMRDALAGRLGAGASRSRAGDSRSRSRRSSKSRERKKGDKKRKQSSASSSGSDDASSESSGSKKKKHKKKKKTKKKKRSRSSSSSSRKSGKSDATSSKSSDCQMEEPAAAASSGAIPRPQSSKADPEVEAAKAEALEQLMKLRSVEPREARMTEWRALLRKWHPDKNPDRVEVATAVFQFLQKGKAILDSK